MRGGGGGKGEKTTGLATVEVPLSLTTSKSRPRHLSASHPPHPQATFRNPPPLRRSLCLRKEKASVWSTIRKRRKNCSTRYTQAALQNRFLNRAGGKGGGRGGEGKWRTTKTQSFLFLLSFWIHCLSHVQNLFNFTEWKSSMLTLPYLRCVLFGHQLFP